jgi:hypothetical protein
VFEPSGIRSVRVAPDSCIGLRTMTVLPLPDDPAPDPGAVLQEDLGFGVSGIVEPGTVSAGMARSSTGSRDGSATPM